MVKCKCSKVLYSVWQGLPVLGKMEHSFAKNSLERENFVMPFISQSELNTWVKHGFNQRADFKETLMSWQTILVGWQVLIQYQQAEENGMGRQCPKASWALCDLESVSYSCGAADCGVKAMAAVHGLCSAFRTVHYDLLVCKPWKLELQANAMALHSES